MFVVAASAADGYPVAAAPTNGPPVLPARHTGAGGAVLMNNS